MEEIAKQLTLFAQQDVKHMVTFFWQNWRGTERRFSKNRYDGKNRPDSNELAAHIHKHQHEFDKDIEVLILKGNLHQKLERELWEDKFICLLGTKAPTGLNIELKHYGREFYEALVDITA